MPLYLPMCAASFRLMLSHLLKFEVLLLKLLADRQGAVVETQDRAGLEHASARRSAA